MIEELRADIHSPESRYIYFLSAKEHYDLCRDILMQLDEAQPGRGFAARAFLVNEKSRARSLQDLVRESQTHLREGATAELLSEEREKGNLIRAFIRSRMEHSPENRTETAEQEDVARRLTELQAEYREIQAKLRSQNSKQALLPNSEVTDLAQIQQELKAGGRMLLQYALGAQQSYLWAITSDSFQSYKLPPQKDIESAAKEVAELLMARLKYDRRAAREYPAAVEEADRLYIEKTRVLSQMLLGPVVNQLGNRPLVLVTEGALQLVPFDALPVPYNQAPDPSGSEVYSIVTNEIVTVPSMTTLLAIRANVKRPPSAGKLVAIIADPVFTRTDDRVDGQRPIIRTASVSREDPAPPDGPSRLIYASEEADAILAVAPRGSTMVAKGFDATRETAMSSSVGEYQIIHFATHGFLDYQHPELSGILLTKVDQNGAEKDGLMALYDIYTLDLSAELTVLSACQTALGKDFKGEGFVGLTHSFMSAGSKSVIGSLWKVDDQATASLMSDFYDLMLRKGMPPVAALRAAKLKMMQNKRWSAPYYWAGFVFQGDYDSRIKVENNSYLSIGLAVLFLALIASGLIVFLARRHRLGPLRQD